jgi:hypothetical protein
MSAISIQVTPSGIRSVVVDQELIFFIGSSPTNPLATTTDYASRDLEVSRLLADGGDRHTELRPLFTVAYGVPIQNLATSLRRGGKRGLSCPNLCIDLVESVAEDGTSIFVSPVRVRICSGCLIWWSGARVSASPPRVMAWPP